MKKTSFYSLHTGNKAILHDGYLDGHFWYYRQGRIWYAIYPESGTAVAIERTLKEAVNKAHERRDAVVMFYDSHPNCIEAFNTAFKKALFE